VSALKSVSFELERGEVRALVGENGAGKSTLIKILTGAVQPDSGVVELDGRAVIDNNPHLSRALGIVAIYQQPSLFPDLTVAENIALATEKQTLLRRVDWRARAREIPRTPGPCRFGHRSGRRSRHAQHAPSSRLSRSAKRWGRMPRC
jgi:rhamnose transport system ATP-binding protein